MANQTLALAIRVGWGDRLVSSDVMHSGTGHPTGVLVTGASRTSVAVKLNPALPATLVQASGATRALQQVTEVELRTRDCLELQLGPALTLRATPCLPTETKRASLEQRVDLFFVNCLLACALVVVVLAIGSANAVGSPSLGDDWPPPRATRQVALLQRQRQVSAQAHAAQPDSAPRRASPAAERRPSKSMRRASTSRPERLPSNVARVLAGLGAVMTADASARVGLPAGLVAATSPWSGGDTWSPQHLKGTGEFALVERASVGALGVTRHLEPTSRRPSLGCAPGRECGPVIGIASGESVSNGLDKELVRRVVHEHRNQLRYCYEAALLTQPRLAGKAIVKFTIADTGAVIDATVSGLGDAGFDECVASRVRTWVFPIARGMGAAKVIYPFVFKAGVEPSAE